MSSNSRIWATVTAAIVSGALAATVPGISAAATGTGTGQTAAAPAVAASVNPDAAGARLWVRRFAGREGLHASAAQSVTVSPRGGRVFVTGFSAIRGIHGGHIGTATTIAYSTVSGARLWLARFAATGTGDGSGASASAIAASPDGETVFVAATTGKDVLHDYATIGYAAATGARLWLARYDGTGGGADHETGIAVSPDGSRVFVTGYSSGAGSGFDYATVTYSVATGTQLWVARYNGPANEDDFAAAVAVSARGDRVYVTGDSHGPASATPGRDDYATIAYSAGTGSQLWVRRHLAPSATSDDRGARAIAVGGDGQRIFVTGSSGRAAVTIAYTAAGQQRWLARYRPAGGASATAIAAGRPGGRSSSPAGAATAMSRSATGPARAGGCGPAFTSEARTSRRSAALLPWQSVPAGARST